MYEILIAGWERALRGYLVPRLDPDEAAALPRLVGVADVGASRANIDYLANVIFNMARRLVSPRPRRVHLSATLASDPRRVTFQLKFDRVVELLRAGDGAIDDPAEQLRSRTIETTFHERHGGNLVLDDIGRPKVFQDHMLYDWNIHHFHIVPGRGNELLFAYLTETDAYLIRIGSHGDFANIAVLEELEVAWPDLLSKLKGLRLPKNPTADEISVLRRSNIVYMVEVGGAIVAPHAFRATDGTPSDVVTSQDRVMQWIRAHVLPWQARVEEALGGAPLGVEIGVVVDGCVPNPTTVRFARGGQGVELIR